MDRRTGALSRVVGMDEDDAADLLSEAWLRHDEAWRQVETFGAGRMAAYCLEAQGIDHDGMLAELTRAFEEASLEVGVEAVDGARDTLAALKDAELGLALVCDTGFTPGRVVRELLDSTDLLGYLDLLCFSDEVGVPKPGHDIFAKALAELGVRPPEAVHVGDLRRTDIAGAHDIGMHAVRFRGVHDDLTDADDARIVIDRHDELLEIVGLRD